MDSKKPLRIRPLLPKAREYTAISFYGVFTVSKNGIRSLTKYDGKISKKSR
jgi:hypothetical protein